MSSGHIIPGWGAGGAGEGGGPTRPVPPEPAHAERARTLVAGQTRGTLSTVGLQPAGTPFGSVVTYGLDEQGRPTFFVSTLAEHTHNLDADPRASLLVVEDTPAGADPLASGRVTLLGVVAEVIEPEERAAARAGYLAANPNAFYVDYGDFRCLRLAVTDVRYVGGFGRMSWVEAAAYATARPDPLRAEAAGIIGHMNADHAGALVALCNLEAGQHEVGDREAGDHGAGDHGAGDQEAGYHGAGRREVVSASMTAVDRYGFEAVAHFGGNHREALRIGFRTPQDTAEGVRRELISMLDAARSSGSGP